MNFKTEIDENGIKTAKLSESSLFLSSFFPFLPFFLVKYRAVDRGLSFLLSLD